MRRLAVFVLAVALLPAACGDDDGGAAAPADEPPWGLDGVDMPATLEEIESVLDELPDEVAGLPGPGVQAGAGGGFSVRYGTGDDEGVMLVAFSIEHIAAAEGRESMTAAEWLGILAEEMGDLEAGSLDAEEGLIWAVAGGSVETGPGTVETIYVAVWAEPDGEWVFHLTAPSPEERKALAQAFVEAAGT